MILLLWIALRGHCPVAEESVGDGSLLPRQTLLRDQVEVEGLFGQCRIVANCPVQELVMWIIRISLQTHTESDYSSSPKCLRAKKVCINQRRGGKNQLLSNSKGFAGKLQIGGAIRWIPESSGHSASSALSCDAFWRFVFSSRRLLVLS